LFGILELLVLYILSEVLVSFFGILPQEFSTGAKALAIGVINFPGLFLALLVFCQNGKDVSIDEWDRKWQVIGLIARELSVFSLLISAAFVF
jgi:cytochrome c-type biogenesis protein CcmE